jgi:N-acetylglutamate synthase-like GNAT family acetyltransferase
MGLQHVRDVSLMRHAYVRTAARGSGVGRALMERLKKETNRPALVGTWAAAAWAIRFYERNGFSLLPREEGAALLHRYWSIPERQTETSVVLADAKWRAGRQGLCA